MMFATLDDLEGSVEMVVFNSAFEANADRVDTCANNPGDHELRLVGARALVLGPEYRVAASGSCLSELEQLPGAALVA